MSISKSVWTGSFSYYDISFGIRSIRFFSSIFFQLLSILNFNFHNIFLNFTSLFSFHTFSVSSCYESHTMNTKTIGNYNSQHHNFRHTRPRIIIFLLFFFSFFHISCHQNQVSSSLAIPSLPGKALAEAPSFTLLNKQNLPRLTLTTSTTKFHRLRITSHCQSYHEFWWCLLHFLFPIFGKGMRLY